MKKSIPKNKKLLVDMLTLMYKIRLFEEKAKELYNKNRREGNFLGALHTYVGQEAIAVGVCASLKKEDYVFSSHRCHGHFIAKGGDLKKMLAELHGKEAGYCKGRGGSMHLFSREIGFMGGNGIVGGGIPLAIGAAFSSKYKNDGRVTCCFFGDGAASQGTFHESLNIAALWKLPVVFVCENNHYAVCTPVSKIISAKNIAELAIGYGISGEIVDGNDVLEVYEVAKKAIEKAREGKGPTLIECKTYRIDPHCMVVLETRSEEEINEWRRKDPIMRFENILLKEKVIDKNDMEKIKEMIIKELKEAEEFTNMSPYPNEENFVREIHYEKD